MRDLVIGVILLFSSIISGCETDTIQPIASLVKIYCYHSSKDTIGNVRLVVQKLFYTQIIYLRDTTDSAYAQTKSLFSVDFSLHNTKKMKIDSSYIPSGSYSSVSFEYHRPAADSALADSTQALFEIAGYIDSTQFLFRSATKFSLYFPDSLVIPKGKTINLLLNIDLITALNPQLGGVDISTAIDGNNDGYILIDLTNIDGNATLAEKILSSIVKNTSIKSQ